MKRQSSLFGFSAQVGVNQTREGVSVITLSASRAGKSFSIRPLLSSLQCSAGSGASSGGRKDNPTGE